MFIKKICKLAFIPPNPPKVDRTGGERGASFFRGRRPSGESECLKKMAGVPQFCTILGERSPGGSALRASSSPLLMAVPPRTQSG